MRKTRHSYLWGALVIASLVPGCSKQSADKRDPVAPPDDLGIQAASTDELWALAPSGTDMGFVAAKGTGELLLAAVEELRASANQHPRGPEFVKAVEELLPQEGAPSPLDRAYYAKMGVDPAGAAALFVDQDQKPLAIVPVTDRAAFRTFIGATLDEASGDDVFGKGICREVGGRYMCAVSEAMFSRVGQDKYVKGAMAELDDDLRGHLEVYVSAGFIRARARDEGDLVAMMGPLQSFHGALQLERGGFHLRGHLKSSPTNPSVAAAARVPSTIANHAATQSPGGFGRLRVPLDDLLPEDAAAEMGPVLALAGIDAKADVLDNITGEMVVYTVAQKGIGMIAEVGFEDGKKLQPAIDFLCAQAKTELPEKMAKISEVSSVDGACKIQMDPDKLGEDRPAKMPDIDAIDLDVYTTERSLAGRVSVVTRHASGAVTPSGPGRDLLLGSWNLALWGYGSFTDIFDDETVGAMYELPDVGADERPYMSLALYLLAHITEVGMGVGVRDDGAHMALRVGTQWANPTPLLREYQSLLVKILDRDASARQALDALAKKSPDTPLGRSQRAGIGGGPLVTVGLAGVVAAIAIPAFLRYQERAAAALDELEERRRRDEEMVRQLEETQDLAQDNEEALQKLDELQRELDETRRAIESDEP